MVLCYNTCMTAFRSDNEVDRDNPHWVGPSRTTSESIPADGRDHSLDAIIDIEESLPAETIYWVREEAGKQSTDALIGHIRSGVKRKEGEGEAEFTIRQDRAYRAGIRRTEEQAYRLMRTTWSDLGPLNQALEEQYRPGRIRFEYQKSGSDLARVLKDTVLAVSDYARPTEMTPEERKQLDDKLAAELDKLAASTDSSDHEKMRLLITFALFNTEARRKHWREQYERVTKRLVGAWIIGRS